MTRPELGLDELPAQGTLAGNVPVLHVPSPGLVRAGLVFGVGQAHETLPTRGASHLVEHVALSALGKPAHEHNGMVELATTTFITHGTPDEVATFLTRVTEALADLPTDRLDLDRRIIRTEAASRAAWPIASLYAWRFGARAQGLTNFFEYGVHSLTADDLRNWAARHFNAANAVVWIAGDLPDDLTLALPRGIPTPPAPIDPLPCSLPGWAPQPGANGAAISSLFAPGARSGAFLHFLTDAAAERLRHREGVSYSVQGWVDRLTKDVQHMAVWADALHPYSAPVAEGLVGTLEHMAEAPPSPDDLAAHCRKLELYYREPEAPIQYVASCAHALALGGKLMTRQELLDDIRALTPDDISQAAWQAMESAIVLVADGVEFPEDRMHPLPKMSDAAVDGKHLRPVLSEGETKASRGTLVVGTDGVSIVYNSNERATVRFGHVAGAASFSDGALLLVGDDGMSIAVVPTAWQNGWTAVEEIKGRLNPSLVVRVPDDEPSDPAAAETAETAPAAAAGQDPWDDGALPQRSVWRLLGGGWRAALVLLAVFVVIVFVSALAGVLAA